MKVVFRSTTYEQSIYVPTRGIPLVRSCSPKGCQVHDELYYLDMGISKWAPILSLSYKKLDYIPNIDVKFYYINPCFRCWSAPHYCEVEKYWWRN